MMITIKIASTSCKAYPLSDQSPANFKSILLIIITKDLIYEKCRLHPYAVGLCHLALLTQLAADISSKNRLAMIYSYVRDQASIAASLRPHVMMMPSINTISGAC